MMKNVFKIFLLSLLFTFVNCTEKDNDIENSEIQPTIFQAIINGQLLNYGNTTDNIHHSVDATLWDNKRLVIRGTDMNLDTSLTLTVGETFSQDLIETRAYKIGTLQDNLETNLFYFDSNDTHTNNNASSENYVGVYSCDVLNSTQVGEITITNLDMVNKTVSGHFNGTLFRWIDITSGELKSIELENGSFNLPYIARNVEDNSNGNVISARVDGFRFMVDFPESPISRRSVSSGLDKIDLIGYDHNFGRIFISVPSDVASGNDYYFQPDLTFQSLGISFSNIINLPENLLSVNPDQSNDSHISIISHNPETNNIEGTFYIENSEIEGRTISEGYFNVNYVDDVDP